MKKILIAFGMIFFPKFLLCSEIFLSSGFNCIYKENEQLLGSLETKGVLEFGRLSTIGDVFILHGENLMVDSPEVTVFLEEVNGTFGNVSSSYSFKDVSHNKNCKIINEIGVYGGGGGIVCKNGSLFLTKILPEVNGGCIGTNCIFFDTWRMDVFFVTGNLRGKDLGEREIVKGLFNCFGGMLDKKFGFRNSAFQLKTGILFGNITCDGKIPVIETIFLRNVHELLGELKLCSLLWDYDFELKLGNMYCRCGIKGAYIPVINGMFTRKEETLFLGKKDIGVERILIDMKNSFLCFPSLQIEYKVDLFRGKISAKLGVEKSMIIPGLGDKQVVQKTPQELMTVLLESGNKFYGEIRF